MAWIRRLVRLPLMLALLAAGLATLRLAFPFMREPARRRTVRAWSRALVWSTGFTLVERPAPGARTLAELPPGRLLLANHVSWVDIFAIDALCPVAFVAKSEVAGWPLLGTLAALTGTLFIERGRRHAVHRMIEHLEHALGAGARIGVFPEGTTSDGLRLLPFHANLAQAAVAARAPIVPVGLRYLDAAGAPSRSIEYVGDTTFLTSVWRLTGAPRQTCEVHALPEFPADGLTRHACAQRARAEISRRLALPLEGSLPEKLRDLRAAPR